MRIAIIPTDINEEGNVPNANPSFDSGFVKRSPKVAPNGRVKIKAIQNKRI